MSCIVSLLLSSSEHELEFQIRNEKNSILGTGSVVRLGSNAAYFELITDSEPYRESARCHNHKEALRMIIDFLQRNSYLKTLNDITLVVHKIPTGGLLHTRHILTTHHDMAQLETLTTLHEDMPAALSTLNATRHQLSSAAHAAIFDTAFTATLPPQAAEYPLHTLLRKRLRRYGAHGIVHKAVYTQAMNCKFKKKYRKVVSVVIDDAVSVTAILDGKVCETSAGFRSTEGLFGMRRTGSLDPKIPFFIMHQLHATPVQVEKLLMTKSGLFALTGKKDYQEIIDGVKASNHACTDALMMLSYKIAQSIASMTVMMSGMDMIIFSGSGNNWIIQEEICRRLNYFGVAIKRTQNNAAQRKNNVQLLHAKNSRVVVASVVVDEWDAMLKEAQLLLTERFVLPKW